jgi:hypothetical protein
MTLISLAMSIVTVLVVVMPSGGCTTAQMQKAADLAQVVATAAPIVAPLCPAITWPVWCVFGIDILSSLAAAGVAFRKQTGTVLK